MNNLRDFFLNQSWWGKLIGAFFGYLAGGSIGAFLGIIIGNVFDRGLFSHFSRPHWSYHAEPREEIQKIFFRATFTMMGYIAKADGRVSEQEIEMARILMDEMRLKKEQKEQAKTFFREGKASNFDPALTLTQLHNACRLNPALLKLFVDIQYRAAKIDGLTENKINALNIIFNRLGLAPLHKQYRFYDDFQYQQQNQHHQYQGSNYHSYSSPSSELDQAYALLEIEKSAGKHEVKKAYRRLISQNHPDKLIAKGLPEEMIKIANEKTQKIRKAYEYICSSKGWHF